MKTLPITITPLKTNIRFGAFPPLRKAESARLTLLNSIAESEEFISQLKENKINEPKFIARLMDSLKILKDQVIPAELPN